MAIRKIVRVRVTNALRWRFWQVEVGHLLHSPVVVVVELGGVVRRVRTRYCGCCCSPDDLLTSAASVVEHVRGEPLRVANNILSQELGGYSMSILGSTILLQG